MTNAGVMRVSCSRAERSSWEDGGTLSEKKLVTMIWDHLSSGMLVEQKTAAVPDMGEHDIFDGLLIAIIAASTNQSLQWTAFGPHRVCFDVFQPQMRHVLFDGK